MLFLLLHNLLDYGELRRSGLSPGITWFDPYFMLVLNDVLLRASKLRFILVFSFTRKRLFSMVNDLPTLFEVVTGRKPLKDKPGVDSGSKSRNSIKVYISLSLTPSIG